MSVSHVRLPELCDQLAFAHTRSELSAAAGVRAVVVDLVGLHRIGLPDPASFAALLGSLPTVTVALTSELHDVLAEEYAAAFDVVVPSGDDAALDELLGAIHANPLAAATLAVLLRGGERRTIEDGLIAESMAYSLLQGGPEFIAWREQRPVRNRPKEIGPAVLTERIDDELTIILARPHVHNAYSTRLRDGLVQALELALADPSISTVRISGAGPSFCSGGDLDEFGSFPDPASSHLIRLARHAGRLIDALGDRVELRLHGAAMGAGIELPAFARRVVADPATTIALPELALGLVPGAGGTVSMPRRIGRQRTAWLGLTGARIDAPTALEWGLIDAIADPPLAHPAGG